MNALSLIPFHRLMRNQWLTADELQEIQNRKLRRIVRHAYRHVPYYRRLFDSVGIRPEDIRTQEDLRHVPITTKRQLQDLPLREITADNIDIGRCIEQHTSGSTGVPLTLYFDRQAKDLKALLDLRVIFANGTRLTDKQVYFTGHRPIPRGDYWFQHLGLLRRTYLSVFNDPVEHIDRLLAMYPNVVLGTSNYLMLLAVEFEQASGRIAPKLVIGLGELLTEDIRERINSVFSVNMIDVYGAVESGIIAWECPEHKGYHINVDTVVAEFVKDGKRVGAGESGEMVVTNLHALAMPFIRYRLGDICVPSEKRCSCGRGLLLMERVEGKSYEFITLPSGKILPPITLRAALWGIRGIRQYKIIQERKDRLLVELVKADAYTEQDAAEIERRIREHVGDEVHVELRAVERISKGTSGKINQITSKVPLAF